MSDHVPEQKMSALKILYEIGIRLVPETPTVAMCQRGSSVGDVDIETVRRIYQAMLLAAGESRLHGDQPLN